MRNIPKAISSTKKANFWHIRDATASKLDLIMILITMFMIWHNYKNNQIKNWNFWLGFNTHLEEIFHKKFIFEFRYSWDIQINQKCELILKYTKIFLSIFQTYLSLTHYPNWLILLNNLKRLLNELKFV